MSDGFEERITQIAQHMPYPAMPQKVTVQRGYQWQMALRIAGIVLLVLLSGLAIPDIRAEVLKILQIGAVTITLEGTTDTGERLRLADISGETDLVTAQANVSYSILVPPDDLPDKVYLQDREMVIMVWLDGNEIERAFFQIAHDLWGISKNVEDVIETTVRGERAMWGYNDHLVTFSNGDEFWTYFVTEQVLIWTDMIVTYRLEADMTRDEAIAFAEALIPYEEAITP